MSAREQMLERIRGALRDAPADEPDHWDPDADQDPAAAFSRHSAAAPDALADLFARRCGEYRATVTRCGAGSDAIRAAVSAACERHRVRTLVVPADLPRDWLPAGVELLPDVPELSIDQLRHADAALTGCALAIALTGTIALDSGVGQGRRAISLVPDLHICVLAVEQIVHGVPEAIAALHLSAVERRPLTLISGPSATSDIELVRVEGVHGPRRLEVIFT